MRFLNQLKVENIGAMKRDNNSGRKTVHLTIAVILGAVLLVAGILFFSLRSQNTVQPKTVSLSEIASGISNGTITGIEDKMMDGEIIIHYQDGSTQIGMRDPNQSLLEQLNLLGLGKDQLAKVQFQFDKLTPPTAGTPVGILVSVVVVLGAVFVALRLNVGDRWGNRKSFAQADVPEIHFEDVAGIDENLAEMKDIVTFLKEGDRYAEIGASMPRGILMVGDPGTGKTLIAKAIAGEAGVPFFATSGSEFSEVFVGVGASRIRALFQKARKNAPCIVFIDEIDAVGRSRHKSESGAEMEQDQTLNQLLVEMDGFNRTEGIIVLAATNRADVLDSALLRPGRFDRRLYINHPDVKGREAILRIHSKGKKLSHDVNLATIAKATPGMVGADLANVVNEAAISAVRSGRAEIARPDFDEAIEKIMAGGVQRKNYMMSEDERRIVAYHEAGHAVVMHTTQHSDPVYKVTIIPRGQAGGYTMALPEEDRMLISRCKILARVTGLLGGRAAEEIFFQDITSGASNDLDRATQIAEEMVMRLGMDPRAGLRVFPSPSLRNSLLGPHSSQKTFETIDEAVNNILESCYSDARRILIEKRDYVEQVANELLEVETVDRDRFEQIMCLPAESTPRIENLTN